MKITQLTLALMLMIVHSDGFVTDEDFRTATVISAATLETAMHEAAPDRVSEQPLSHVESAEGRLGIGIVHRPVIAPGSPIDAIQHHKQSEVYRIMAGKGVLVTSKSMVDNAAIDPHGFSEISEAITYRVVRVDPESLVALK